MRKSKEQANLYSANIRKLMVVQHDMPALEMQKQLQKLGIHLHVEYIRRLREKILGERMRRVDRKSLNMALAAFEDVLTETARTAWQIALSPQATRMERLIAIKEIRESHTVIFNKLFDAGVFDRKLGSVDVNVKRSRPLSQDVEEEIFAAFQRWGIFPAQHNANDGNKSIESGAAVQ
jgi:hypothetical protein